eukprot:364347-Chlamydomonas_euryale.AAC.26
MHARVSAGCLRYLRRRCSLCARLVRVRAYVRARERFGGEGSFWEGAWRACTCMRLDITPQCRVWSAQKRRDSIARAVKCCSQSAAAGRCGVLMRHVVAASCCDVLLRRAVAACKRRKHSMTGRMEQDLARPSDLKPVITENQFSKVNIIWQLENHQRAAAAAAAACGQY